MTEEEKDFDFKEVLLNKTLTTSRDVTINDLEFKSIKYALEQGEKVKSIFPKIPSLQLNNLELIDRNFYYDSYKFQYEDKYFCLKLGSNDDSYYIKKEISALNKLKNKNVCPTSYLFEELKEFSLSIISYEFGEPINKLNPNLIIFENLDEFIKQLKTVHTGFKPKQNQLKTVIENHKSMCSFEEVLPEKLFNTFKDIDLYKKVKDFLPFLIDVLELQASPMLKDKDLALCHFNLNTSNILFRDGMFKFINFHNFYYLHPLFDIASLSLNLDLNSLPGLDKKILEAYYGKNCKEAVNALPAFKDIIFKLILINLISSFFYKVLFPKWESSQNFALNAIKSYQTIRPMVKNEFYTQHEFLDDMFGNVNNSI
jgi:Ser/Thr protein kinase RdoA (MazF antagonist)